MRQLSMDPFKRPTRLVFCKCQNWLGTQSYPIDFQDILSCPTEWDVLVIARSVTVAATGLIPMASR